MNKAIKIALVECPYLLRTGLVQTLRNSSELRCHILELNDISHLKDSLNLHHPDMIVVNPHNACGFKLSEINSFCNSYPSTKLTAVCYAYLDQQTTELFHAIFNIDDTPEKIHDKINKLFHKTTTTPEPETENQELTQREKEIVVGVVKGQTNKEIADTLSISAHTVISHRRNIAKKLQIHSPSGLTIYAILNKLVDINDIKL